MSQVVLPIVLPLLLAFLLPVVMRPLPGVGRWLGPLLLVYDLWLLGQAWPVAGAAPFSVAIGDFAPPFGINLYIDSLALLFALAVQLMGLLLWPWADDEEAPRRQSLALLLIASSTGMALSGDLFNIYVWYELASVAAFGLVIDPTRAASFAASLRYLLISGLGSVLTLVGITLIYVRTGTLNLAQIAELAPGTLNHPLGLGALVLMLLGFGVKAELFPVNHWVPGVYASAPARISALLAGVISKLAVLVLVRLLYLLQPGPEMAGLVAGLGILGVISGELAAWRARDLRRMLAYSSIGQLGMIFIAFSLPGKAGALAGLALVLHHLVVKSGLFLLAERWDGALDRLRGAGRVSPLAGGLFVLFALSIVGVPPLPGFWAKLLLLQGLAAEGGWLYGTALAVFLAATVVEASYLLRVADRLFATPEGEAPRPSFGGLALTSLLGGGLLVALLTLNPLARTLDRVAGVAVDRDGYPLRSLPRERGRVGE
ncbi:MAG: NADH-quinone oxidoreductase subunit J, partial [Gammaproteobacteria bacterium]